jgi:hypothetical protein
MLAAVEGWSRIRVRVALALGSLLVAGGQMLSAPADARHHVDTGANVLLHQLGPLLLVVVPLVALAVAVVHRIRRGALRTIHLPTFLVCAAAVEACGLVLGIAHHGVAPTLLLAAVGVASMLLTAAAGASAVLVARHRVRRARRARPARVAKPSPAFSLPHPRRVIALAHARRGPPALSGC